jgi:hypothetical protein
LFYWRSLLATAPLLLLLLLRSILLLRGGIRPLPRLMSTSISLSSSIAANTFDFFLKSAAISLEMSCSDSSSSEKFTRSDSFEAEFSIENTTFLSLPLCSSVSSDTLKFGKLISAFCGF